MYQIRRVIETQMVSVGVAGMLCLGALLTRTAAAQAATGTAAPGGCSPADVKLAITISHLVEQDVGCHEAARLRHKGTG